LFFQYASLANSNQRSMREALGMLFDFELSNRVLFL